MEGNECCLRQRHAFSRMLKWFYKDDKRNIYGPICSFKLVYYIYSNYFEEDTPFTYSVDEDYREKEFDDLVKHLWQLERDFLEYHKDVFACSHYMLELLNSDSDGIDTEIRLLEPGSPGLHQSHGSPVSDEFEEQETESALITGEFEEPTQQGKDSSYIGGDKFLYDMGFSNVPRGHNSLEERLDHSSINYDEALYPASQLEEHMANKGKNIAISLPPDVMTNMCPERALSDNLHLPKDGFESPYAMGGGLYAAVGRDDGMIGGTEDEVNEGMNFGSHHVRNDAMFDVNYDAGYLGDLGPVASTYPYEYNGTSGRIIRRNKGDYGINATGYFGDQGTQIKDGNVTVDDIDALPPINIIPPLTIGSENPDEIYSSTREGYAAKLDSARRSAGRTCQGHAEVPESLGPMTIDDDHVRSVPYNIRDNGTNSARLEGRSWTTQVNIDTPDNEEGQKKKSVLSHSYGGQNMFSNVFSHEAAASPHKVENNSSTTKNQVSGVMHAHQVLIKQRMQNNLREAQAHLARIPTRKVSHMIGQPRGYVPL